MNNPQIFITGVTGFVGQNLSNYLERNFDIQGISRNKNNCSLTFDMFFRGNHSYGALIHLAGKAHDLKNTSQDKDYYDVNFELTKRLFDEFLKSEAKQFIYISSVKAAADAVEGILTEEVTPNPVTVYGKSKLMAEEYILAHLPVDKKVYILRPCMIHGPGNRGNLNLLYAIVRKSFPWPLGAFINERSFCSIENLCFVIKELLGQDSIPSDVYNVADDDAISTNRLVEIIAEVSGKKANLLKIPKVLITTGAKIGDKIKLPLNSETVKKLTENYRVSNDKIKKAIGIVNLPISASEGLEKTIKSFMK